MKKINLIALIWLLFMGINLFTMEIEVNNKRKRQAEKAEKIEGKTKRNRVDEDGDEVEQTEEIGWNSLSAEIQMRILSFLVKTDDLKEMIDNKKDLLDIFRQLAILRSINPQFRAIVFDKKTLEGLVEHLVEKAMANSVYNKYIFELIILAARWYKDFYEKLVIANLLPASSNSLLLSAILDQKAERVQKLTRLCNSKMLSAYKKGIVKGMTEIMLAAAIGNVEILKLLLEARGIGINDSDREKETALMLATKFECRKAIQFLLDHGTNINAKDRDGESVLMKAVCRGRLRILRFLLERGADVNLKNNIGWTALMLAASSVNGNKETIDLLLDEGIVIAEINRAFMRASENGNLEGMKALIAGGADINQKFGQTAFLHAVKHGREQIVKFLLDMNVDIDQEDESGNTALTLCVYLVNVEILELLLERGADVSKRNKNGKTALDIAESQPAFLNFSKKTKAKNKEERRKCYETIIRSLKAFTQIIDLDL